MKTRYIILLPALLGCFRSYSQVENTIFHKEVSKKVNNGRELLETITEYDGLGRPVTNTVLKANPLEQDLVSFTVYDCMGRPDSIQYLPYPSLNVQARPSAAVNDGWDDRFAPKSHREKQAEYYASVFPEDGNYAYSRKTYDRSGQNQCIASYAPGADFSLDSPTGDRPVTYEQRLNVSSDSIKCFSMKRSRTPLYEGFYAPGTLTVKTTTAPDDTRCSEYIDAGGQVIAKECAVASGRPERTYYIFDEFGRQRYIVPAILERELTTVNRVYNTDEFTKYGYYYEYDQYGQVVKQILPGSLETIFLYDKRHRLVLSQDDNQRSHPDSVRWTFYKYDALDRPILTGTIHGGTLEEHQAALENATAHYEVRKLLGIHGYSNDCYPMIEFSDVLTVTYYDEYHWELKMAAASSYNYEYQNVLGEECLPAAKGQITGTKRRVLGIDKDVWLTTILYYNNKYQPIQSVAQLYPIGIEYVHNKYDFQGNIVQVRVRQNLDPPEGGETGRPLDGPGKIDTGMFSEPVRPGIIDVPKIPQLFGYDKLFRYDSWGRLLDERHVLLNRTDTVTVASYTYDRMGDLQREDYHNGSYRIDYRKNIQGMTVGAESSEFTYHLGVNRDALIGKPHFNGRLNYMKWKRPAQPEHAYVFDYTPRGELQAANHYEWSAGNWQRTDAYTEQGMSYDLNGNLLTMRRTDGAGNVVEQVSNQYHGNVLLRQLFPDIPQTRKVPINPNLIYYKYDYNGNLTHDPNEGYDIEYNSIDLPSRIFDGSHEIRYIYASDGEKLASVADGSFTYYRTTMVYADAANGKQRLLYMLHDKGIISHETSGYEYKYFVKDHLGSTRSLLAATDTGMIVEQTADYYPYGLSWSHDDLQRNRRLYVGKELQDASVGGTGFLGLYDFGSRYYNPRIGRWFNIDPALQGLNPYVYCGNSPMMYVDRDGEFFLSFLAALFCPALLPFTLGTDMGIMQGGFRSLSQGNSFWSGAWKGAITGLTGSGLSIIGGSGMNFISNLGLGIAEGSAVGALDGALWGEDIYKGMLYGAAGGAVLTTITSENMNNLLHGEGFRTNSNVFDRMIARNMDKQDILDYFGFPGKYDPNSESKLFKSGKGNYWGKTTKDGTIFYGNFAFEDYASLKGIYIKESYHSNRVLNGLGWAKLPKDTPITLKNHLEEINGYNYAYKRQGLFSGHHIPFSGIDRYTQEMNVFGYAYKSFPKHFRWIYYIPRRW